MASAAVNDRKTDAPKTPLTMTDHTVKATIGISYALERMVAKEQQQAPRQKTPKTPTKSSKPDVTEKSDSMAEKPKVEVFKKFYITYAFGQGCEGKTETLAWNLTSWHASHDLTVNLNYIVGIYERPPTFTVWEVVKNESVDRTTLQALYQQCGNGFKSRKGGWPTTEARNRSFEALARRRVSLARTSVLRRPSATGGVRKSVNPSFDSKKTLGKRYIEPFHRETSEKQQHTALILERDFLTHPNRQQSNPELASIARYPASYGKRPDSGRSTDSSNRSARDTPHPHHYAHPEKHAPYDLIYNGLVKSRSASSLSALSALRPKTPPSPHHAHLPINMMAPPGTLFQEDGKTGGISPIKITQEMVKAKEVERNSLRETKRAVAGAKLAATKQLAPEDQFLTGKDASSEQTKVKVKFDLEVPDQTAVPKSDAEREKQRRSINLSKSKRMSISARVAYDTKRSGEYSHVPVARVTMDMIDLFLGEKEIEAEVKDKIAGMKYAKFSIKLGSALLTQEQESILNPMCITIGEADGMPSNPVSYEQLDSLCQPVFCQFRFFGDPYSHKSFTDSRHGYRVSFNNRHLILPGLIDEEQLRDDLLYKTFKVQVHDRDYRLPDNLSKLAEELGPDGELSSNLNPTAPYGQASFSLVELSSGVTNVELSSQIVPVNVRREDKTLPAAYWFENSATLSISVSLKQSILLNPVPEYVPHDHGEYNRLVMKAPAQFVELFEQIKIFIDLHNAEVLHVNDGMARIRLATYKLSADQRKDSSLDVLNGFHLYDGTDRIIMLEGLKRGALLQLARLIASRDSVLLFFNPGLGFSTRAWDPLNPGLNHIQIRESFHTLFEPKKNRTGLYSKLSMRSLDCIASIRELLDPLTGLDRKMSRVPSSVLLFALLEDVGELIGAERAWTVTKTDDGLMMGNDTNGQEKSSRTESVPLGEKKPASLLLKKSPQGPQNSKSMASLLKKSISRIDDSNPVFDEWLKTQGLRIPNFVRIQAKPWDDIPKAKPKARSREPQVFNYSIQSGSTTASQLNALRERIKRDPSHVYAYGPLLYSQLAPPLDASEERKRLTLESMSKWKTRNGFWSG